MYLRLVSFQLLHCFDYFTRTSSCVLPLVRRSLQFSGTSFMSTSVTTISSEVVGTGALGEVWKMWKNKSHYKHFNKCIKANKVHMILLQGFKLCTPLPVMVEESIIFLLPLTWHLFWQPWLQPFQLLPEGLVFLHQVSRTLLLFVVAGKLYCWKQPCWQLPIKRHDALRFHYSSAALHLHSV